MLVKTETPRTNSPKKKIGIKILTLVFSMMTIYTSWTGWAVRDFIAASTGKAGIVGIAKVSGSTGTGYGVASYEF